MSMVIASGMRAHATRMLTSSPLRLTTLSTLAAAVSSSSTIASSTTSSHASIPHSMPPPSVPAFAPIPIPTPSPAALMAQGKLLPTSLIDSLLFSRLSSLSSYILDGYPRTASQARTLVSSASSSLPDAVVLLTAPDSVSFQRIQNRSQGRADDADPSVAVDRLAAYASNERAILQVFHQAGVRVIEVDASHNNARAVFDALCEQLKASDLLHNDMKNNLVMMGPPGVGKGTQGKMLSQLSGCEHVSVGDIVRSQLSSSH